MIDTKRIGNPILIPVLVVAMALAFAMSIAPATAQGPPPACDGEECEEHKCGPACICNPHHNICLDNT